jgi:hypothetical protein
LIILVGWKTHQPGTSLPSKLTLGLIRPSFAKQYLMKAIFGFAWAVAVPLGDDTTSMKLYIELSQFPVLDRLALDPKF